MKRPVVVAVLLAVLLAPSFSPCSEQEENRFPFFPSNLNSIDGQPVPSTEFEDPSVCRSCHPDIYKQWKGSMHSNAMIDPIFLALWKIGIKETDGMVEQLCAGCHSAIGTLAGEIKQKDDGTFEMSDIARKGVQCDLCHTITATTMHLTPILEPYNASIIVDPGDVKRGPYDDSESPYHDTEYSDLHTRSEFCANCHNVFHPVSRFPIERTYDEWKNSVYAQAGIQCQDCHMMPVELAIEAARTLKKQKNPGKPCIMGPEREQMYTHEFIGGNAFITGMLGSPMHAALSEKRLKHAASMKLQLPDTVSPGELVRMKVTVRNETAGHNLPTSLTELRQVWLEINVTDGEGNAVYRNGGIDESGNIDGNAIMFNAVAMDKDDHHTSKPWEIVRFESVDTIQPKGSAEVPYAFLVPDGSKGPLTVKATLHYRTIDQALANFLLGDEAQKVPTIDMVSAEGTIGLP